MIRSYELGVLFLPSAFVSPRGCLTRVSEREGGTCSHLWASQVALVVKNPLANTGHIRDASLIPGLGRFPGGGHGNPLQRSCLETPMDRGAWWAYSPRVAQSRTQLKCTHARGFSSLVSVTCPRSGGQTAVNLFPDHSSGCRVITALKEYIQ